ncbi:unnamed protein product [Gongylonema pulchrum]|uniref:DNA_pol_B_exo1 domain-containing protein n=1 Tax=Gongylonema pulchrum TaxID=637853 RepID=A0A183EEI1_9BILA|nr:unnamed protein product [Gongylonema pulchrum]
MAEQLFTESFIEQPSFISYENMKEKLEQTFAIPSVTPKSDDSEQSDIRHLCVMSMEILALVSRGMPVPDPQSNEIVGIFYSISTDICAQDDQTDVDGVLLNMDSSLIGHSEQYTYVESEAELLDAFVSIINKYDPDIVVGYNTQRYSWGYLVERALVIGRNVLSEISRYPVDINEYYRPVQQRRSRWVKDLDPTPRGRILLNIWRILRYEVALRNYAMSNVVDAVLKRRFPEYSFKTLSDWMLSSEEGLM